MRELIMTLMERYGYPGIFLLIAVENIFPPIPSEIILPFGGFLTTYTRLTIFGVVFYSTLGSLAGALVLYGAGRIFNRERLMKLAAGPVGKVLCLKPADVAKADGWFLEKGTKTVFFCRFIPIVRSLISVPAGMSRMPMGMFLAYTTAGTILWNTALVSLGAVLGESWGRIAYLVGEYSHIMLIVISISTISGIIWLYRTRPGDGSRRGRRSPR